MTFKIKFKRVLIFIIILMLINTSFLPAAQARQYGPELYNEIFEMVKDYYIDYIEDEYLFQGAIEGMLWHLDPYSTYFTEEQYEQFSDSMDNSYTGIGIYLEEIDGCIVIVGVIPGTPAGRAGIIVGDRIIAVNDTNVVGHSLYEAGLLMQGEAGTKINLLIQREGEAELIEVNLTREKVSIPPAEYEILEGNLGYLRLDIFNDKADSYVSSALNYLRQEKVAGLILDLRSNPGGYMYSAVDIAGHFVDGPVVYLAGRDGEKEPLVAPMREKWDRPLVVLVDYYTASAAEILAGAIQDYKKGVLVGDITYGKGSTQSLIELENGGYLKLTTYNFYTPQGKEIEWVGIEPDYPVEDDTEIFPRGQAVLWNLLYPGCTVFVSNNCYTFYNGSSAKMNIPPEMINGQLYLPLRSILDVFSFKPVWNSESRKISFLDDNGEVVSFKAGDKTVHVGERKHLLSAPAVIKNGTTMVPVEFLNVCGIKYRLSDDEKAVIISTP